MLVCYNALVIPLLFLSDFVGMTVLGYVIAVISMITVIGFAVKFVRSLIRK